MFDFVPQIACYADSDEEEKSDMRSDLTGKLTLLCYFTFST